MFVCLITINEKKHSTQSQICSYLDKIVVNHVTHLKSFIENCSSVCMPSKRNCMGLIWVFFYPVRILNVMKDTCYIKSWTFYSGWEFYIFSFMPIHFLQPFISYPQLEHFPLNLHFKTHLFKLIQLTQKAIQ